MTERVNGTIDVETVKAAARGRWPEILTTVGGFDPAILDGQHHPCPKCGGNDRFRMISEDDGAVFCNQCFSEKNGDGIAAIQWNLGIPFPDAKAKLMDHLHIESNPATDGDSPKPAKTTTKSDAVDATSLFDQLGEIIEDLHPTLIDLFCEAKPPITPASINAAGGKVKRWPKKSPGDNRVLAFYAVDDFGNIRGILLRRITGEDFAAYGKTAASKTRMVKGSRDGWVIPGGLDRLKQAEVVWKVEGVPDALALFPLLPDGQAVITNIAGAKSVPPFMGVFRDKFLVIIGDDDKPGQEGATIYARKITGIASDVKVVKLPYDVTEDHGKDLRDFLNDGGTFADLQKLVAEATAWKDDGKSKDGRTEIILRTAEHEVIDEIVVGLKADPELYQRGGALVQIVREPDNRDGIERPPSMPRIVTIPQATLRGRTTRFCHIVRMDSEGELSPAHPPEWAIKGVYSLQQWPGIRSLTGIASTPILRPDGSILTTTGFDPMTGLYLDCGSLVVTVPENPTRDQAQDAAMLLQDVFADFPFEQVYHISAAIALVLTPFARQAFRGPVPLFLIDANVRGSGKSLFADAIGLIVLGDDLPRMSNPGDDDEARKRITSLAIRGDSLCLIDNITTEFGGASIDAALTSTRWQDRILGRSEVVDMPLAITWLATGNNVVLMGDTSRRICHIRLNCKEERPEERDGFRHANLRAHVHQHRAELVSACLTILRAFHVAGRPQAKLSGWGSYEGWSELVRQAVVWLGFPDPAAGRIELMNRADTQLQALRQLIECWHEVDPHGEGITTSGLMDLLSRCRDGYHGVREALLEMCGGSPDKLPGVKAVGNKLRHIRGRIVGGKAMDSRENRKHQQVWRVIDALSASSASSVPGYPV